MDVVIALADCTPKAFGDREGLDAGKANGRALKCLFRCASSLRIMRDVSDRFAGLDFGGLSEIE